MLSFDCCDKKFKALFQEWIDNRGCGIKTAELADKIVAACTKCGRDYCKQIVALKDHLVKKSQWIFGGDGWAYAVFHTYQVEQRKKIIQ